MVCSSAQRDLALDAQQPNSFDSTFMHRQAYDMETTHLKTSFARGLGLPVMSAINHVLQRAYSLLRPKKSAFFNGSNDIA